MSCLRITHTRLSKELVKNTDPLGLQPRFTDSEFGAGVGPFHKCPGASNAHHRPKTTGGAELLPTTTCVPSSTPPVLPSAPVTTLPFSSKPTFTAGLCYCSSATFPGGGRGLGSSFQKVISILSLSLRSSFSLPSPPFFPLSRWPAALPHGWLLLEFPWRGQLSSEFC